MFGIPGLLRRLAKRLNWRSGWAWRVAGLFLLGQSVFPATGCKQQVFVTERDLEHYRAIGLPQGLETDPQPAVIPTQVANAPAPATVLDSEREPRYITLAEAIAIALEHGNVGVPAPNNPGQQNDSLVNFLGSGAGLDDDAIRVLALDPAITGANIEAALSKFDTRWVTSMNWQKVDNAVANILQNFQNGDQATFSTALLKPLPTGGVAGITWNTNYNLLSNAGNFQVINPAYRPSIQLLFEQPLLQGAGVEINQLTRLHPGSITNPNLRPSGGTQVEGILITRLRYEQSRAEFERRVAILLLNVEAAYWQLYGAYFNLYAREQGLRQSYEVFQSNLQQFQAGRLNAADYQRSRGQFELFRAQRIQALGQVLENERQLRGLLGMPTEDGTRLVPIDAPVLSPFKPDYTCAVNEMLANRPELVIARQELKARQLDLIAQKNFLRPDLRFFATYDYNGLGSRLDGPAEVNALKSLASGDFHNWQIGLNMNIPLGFREAHAQVRQARLQLTRSYLILNDQEIKAERFLALQYRRLDEFYEQIRALRAQRIANGEQLKVRLERVAAGQDSPGSLDLLTAVQQFADSLSQEFQAIVNYNITLCNFQFAKGTLLKYDNVVIADGQLPTCAAVRAVDAQRARSAALLLRERQVAQVEASAPHTRPGIVGTDITALTGMVNNPPSLARFEDDFRQSCEGGDVRDLPSMRSPLTQPIQSALPAPMAPTMPAPATSATPAPSTMPTMPSLPAPTPAVPAVPTAPNQPASATPLLPGGLPTNPAMPLPTPPTQPQPERLPSPYAGNAGASAADSLRQTPPMYRPPARTLTAAPPTATTPSTTPPTIPTTTPPPTRPMIGTTPGNRPISYADVPPPPPPPPIRRD
jgi:outer membrane protein TolC